MNNLIIGTQYNCWKKKRKNRQDIIDKMHVGDRVYFEKTEYEGEPLVLVIDCKTGLEYAGRLMWLCLKGDTTKGNSSQGTVRLIVKPFCDIYPSSAFRFAI